RHGHHGPRAPIRRVLGVAGDPRGRGLVERRHRGLRVQVIDERAQHARPANALFPEAGHEGLAVGHAEPGIGCQRRGRRARRSMRCGPGIRLLHVRFLARTRLLRPASAQTDNQSTPFKAGRPDLDLDGTVGPTIPMASIAPLLGRLIRPIWVGLGRNVTSWAAVGTTVALTGFGPEHWFAAAFRYVEMPQAGLVWPSWLDIRAVIVSLGVAIVVADVLVRRMRREKAVAGPAGAEAPSPRSAEVSGTVRFQAADEHPAGDPAARATDAGRPSAAPSLP